MIPTLLIITILALVHALWEHTLLRRTLINMNHMNAANRDLASTLSEARAAFHRSASYLEGELAEEKRLHMALFKRRAKESAGIALGASDGRDVLVGGIPVPEGEDVENAPHFFDDDWWW